MKHLLILFMVGICTLALGQDVLDEDKFEKVEILPQFDGGMAAFNQYLTDNMEYPLQAMKKGIEGRVYLQFVVDTTGNIVNESITILKGVHESLNLEAIRLIKESPTWIPGRFTSEGVPAKVKMVIPITFRLDKQSNKKKKGNL